MSPDVQIMNQIAPYQSWLTIAGVLLLFILLRLTRRTLRRRVDEIGYRLFRERGQRIWFWLNAPGVIIHELSHALIVILFWPWGFRLTSVTLFRIRPIEQRDPNGYIVRRGGPTSLQLGEVQYLRPQRQFMSYIGDGMSGIAPLIGGTAVFMFLYWAATGFNLWDIPYNTTTHSFQILKAGWPWWTLIVTPYFILTVTSELWPSRQDWRGSRWFVGGLTLLLALALGLLWYYHKFPQVFALSTFVASRIDFALLVLLALDIIFLLVAEAIVQVLRS